jgi:hypothetical protein
MNFNQQIYYYYAIKKKNLTFFYPLSVIINATTRNANQISFFKKYFLTPTMHVNHIGTFTSIQY